MITSIGLFITNFIYIFLKAFQQKNVMHDEWKFVLPTSLGMAFCEVFVIGVIAKIVSSSEFDAMHLIINALAIGSGGGLGCMASMYLHGRLKQYLRNNNNRGVHSISGS